MECEYSSATADDIVQILERAPLEQVCSPTSGDCVLVAVAAAEVFPIDGYYVAVQPGQQYSRPAHIAVVKDDVIIDGDGRQTKSRMKEYATTGLPSSEQELADWGTADRSLFETIPQKKTGKYDDVLTVLCSTADEYFS